MNPSSVLETIAARRSVGRLADPAPDDEQLRTILTAAAAAPDHGSLRPWRFVVLRGAAKDAFGAVLADALLARSAAAGTTPTEGQVSKERTKLGRAPLVLVVAAEPTAAQSGAPIPWVEQQMAAAAAAQNALLAATALGFGSMWRTGEPAYDSSVKRALGLSEEAAIVGFLYLGTIPPGTDRTPNEPDLDGVVAEWQPPKQEDA